MALEIEAKLKVDDFGDVLQRLEALGATSHGTRLETNLFLDTEDRSLLAGDEGLRIRLMQDEAGEVTCAVTYKGPRRQVELKSRDEIELSVNGCDEAEALFERLGYVRVLSFEKRRHTWAIGSCLVELDELPLLGNFVEIEGDAEAQIMQVREQLGLAERPLVKEAYVALLLAHLQEHGRTEREIVFE